MRKKANEEKFQWAGNKKLTVGWKEFQPKINPPRNTKTVLESSSLLFYRFRINFYVVMYVVKAENWPKIF